MEYVHGWIYRFRVRVRKVYQAVSTLNYTTVVAPTVFNNGSWLASSRPVGHSSTVVYQLFTLAAS